MSEMSDTFCEVCHSPYRAFRRIDVLLMYPDDARRRTMMKMFRNALAPFEHHVGVVELVDSVRSVLCPLKMRDMWNVEGAEEYWDVAPRERPEYRLPWNE